MLLPKVMIANAGMCRIKPMLDMTTEEWEQEIAVNLTGKNSYNPGMNLLSHTSQARFISINWQLNR
jgi:NAD(P)-dependent dehydrogenase (short-subunit alcohol dehydrogenase family)